MHRKRPILIALAFFVLAGTLLAYPWVITQRETPLRCGNGLLHGYGQHIQTGLGA